MGLFNKIKAGGRLLVSALSITATFAIVGATAATTYWINNPDFENMDEFGYPIDWNLPNGTLTSNPMWAVNCDSLDKHGGKYSLHIKCLRYNDVAGQDSSAHVMQDVLPSVPGMAGHTLTVTAWVKTAGNASLSLIFHTGKGMPSPVWWQHLGWSGIANQAHADWTQVTGTATIPIDATTCAFRIWLPNQTPINAEAWVDDITISDPEVGVIYSSNNPRSSVAPRYTSKNPMTVLDARGRVINASRTSSVAKGLYLAKIQGASAQSLPVMSK